MDYNTALWGLCWKADCNYTHPTAAKGRRKAGHMLKNRELD